MPNKMPEEMPVREGVNLRYLTPADAERVMEILDADPEIKDRVTWTHRITNKRLAELTIGLIQRTSFRYAIIQGDIMVGYVGGWEDDDGYFDGIPKQGEFGFGYFIDPAFRGQGIVLDSAQAMMQEMEKRLDVQRYAVYVADDNPASQAILEKLGFSATDIVYEEPVMHCPERRWEKVPNNE